MDRLFNATDQQKIQAFINRSKNAGFCNTELDDFALLYTKADKDLFAKVLNSPDHVLHPLLPPHAQQNTTIWEIDHTTDNSENVHLVQSTAILLFACFIIICIDFYTILFRFYRAMHFSAYAGSWDRMSSVRLSVCPSVRPSVRLWRWWIVIT